ncbi:hypothetical protein AMECASPLE_032461, partial [Ameca splendens]
RPWRVESALILSVKSISVVTLVQRIAQVNTQVLISVHHLNASSLDVQWCQCGGYGGEGHGSTGTSPQSCVHCLYTVGESSLPVMRTMTESLENVCRLQPGKLIEKSTV